MHPPLIQARSILRVPVKEMVMRFRLNKLFNARCRISAARMAPALVLLGVLGACTSQAARVTETAAAEAATAAAAQEAARIAQERERQNALEQQRMREAQAAEQARLAAARERREAEAEAERRRQEEAERSERERLLAIAEAEAERQEKLDRIAQLERQIAAIEPGIGQDEAAIAVLQEAILVAEELLDALAEEQAKYANTDDDGNTVEPLAKELLAELEARKDNLVRQAQSQ
jgi:colicin import membrane protein